MTQYINVGARLGHDGERIKTKAALRRQLAEDPSVVLFDATSGFGSQDPIRGDEIQPGVTLQVCGPDPYSDRRWYASVQLGASGKPVVK